VRERPRARGLQVFERYSTFHVISNLPAARAGGHGRLAFRASLRSHTNAPLPRTRGSFVPRRHDVILLRTPAVAQSPQRPQVLLRYDLRAADGVGPGRSGPGGILQAALNAAHRGRDRAARRGATYTGHFTVAVQERPRGGFTSSPRRWRVSPRRDGGDPGQASLMPKLLTERSHAAPAVIHPKRTAWISHASGQFSGSPARSTRVPAAGRSPAPRTRCNPPAPLLYGQREVARVRTPACRRSRPGLRRVERRLQIPPGPDGQVRPVGRARSYSSRTCGRSVIGRPPGVGEQYQHRGDGGTRQTRVCAVEGHSVRPRASTEMQRPCPPARR